LAGFTSVPNLGKWIYEKHIGFFPRARLQRHLFAVGLGAIGAGFWQFYGWPVTLIVAGVVVFGMGCAAIYGGMHC